MLKYAILITLTVGCLINQGEAFFGKDGFSNLNAYLVDREESSDPAKNMAVVLDVLSGEEASQKSGALVKEATMFAELAYTEGNCDRDSVEAIRKNNEATKGAGFSKNPPLRRVDYLVYRYALQHAKRCPKAYQQVVASRVEALEPETRKRVEYFYRQIMESMIDEYRFGGKTYINIQDIFDKRRSFKSIVDSSIRTFAKKAFYAIRSYAKQDPDVIYTTALLDEKKGSRYADSGKLKELLDNYVVSPCKSYTDAMGDIYELTEFDAKIGIPYETESSRDMELFKDRWQTNLVCKLFDDKKMVNSLVSEMVKVLQS